MLVIAQECARPAVIEAAPTVAALTRSGSRSACPVGLGVAVAAMRPRAAREIRLGANVAGISLGTAVAGLWLGAAAAGLSLAAAAGFGAAVAGVADSRRAASAAAAAALRRPSATWCLRPSMCQRASVCVFY